MDRTEGHNLLKKYTDGLEKWYYGIDEKTTNEIWPINEIVYACTSVLKECLQKLEGYHFALDFIEEKTNTIAKLAKSL